MKRWLSAAIVAGVMVAGVALAPDAVADPPPDGGAPAGSGSASAAKQTPVSPLFAEMLILHATNTAGGIDPRIKHLKDQLTKPPFSAYDTYKLLSQSKQQTPDGQPVETVLPNGRTLRLTYRGPIEIKDTKELRYKVSASITEPKGKEFLPLLEWNAKLDDNLFVAGQSYQNGILVLGIKVVRLGPTPRAPRAISEQRAA